MAGLGWVLYSLAFSAYAAPVVQISFPTAVLQQLHGNLILALLSIPVWLLTVRRMDRMRAGAGKSPFTRSSPRFMRYAASKQSLGGST